MKWFSEKKWAASLAMLGLLSGVQNPSQAQSFQSRYSQLTSCQQVRTYQAQAGISNRELATLEYRYCVQNDPYYSNYRRPVDPIFVSIPSASASQDCVNATILTRLAIASDPYSILSSEVAGFRQILCSLPESGRQSNNIFEWSNGRNAKFGSTWYYPNGQKAKFGKTWYYPNGKKVNFGSTWYYPNGKTAKFGRNWSFPDGSSTDLTSLLSWSCGVLSYFDCQERLADLQVVEGFWYDLTVIELSSRAYNDVYSYRRYDDYGRGNPDIDIDIDIIIK
ncbi:MAG: hypothetical protein WBB82_13310 [Limnothrix sp.]